MTIKTPFFDIDMKVRLRWYPGMARRLVREGGASLADVARCMGWPLWLTRRVCR